MVIPHKMGEVAKLTRGKFIADAITHFNVQNQLHPRSAYVTSIFKAVSHHIPHFYTFGMQLSGHMSSSTSSSHDFQNNFPEHHFVNNSSNCVFFNHVKSPTSSSLEFFFRFQNLIFNKNRLDFHFLFGKSFPHFPLFLKCFKISVNLIP